MKKTFLILMFAMLSTLCAMAAAPKLDCEQYFGEKYRNDPTTKVVVVTGTGNYFRSIKVYDNQKLVSEIKKAVERDRRHASNVTETYSHDKTSIILNLADGINVGFTQKETGSCTLFVQGSPDAFK